MNSRILQIENYTKEIALKKLGLPTSDNITVQELTRGGYNVNYLVKVGQKSFLFRINLHHYIDVPNH